MGEPTQVEAERSVILDLPAGRVSILGRISAAFPSKEEAPIELHLDVFGLTHPAQRLISIDASLRDSHVLAFDLRGDLPFRLTWGHQPAFLFSLDGFHKDFRPPTGFPTLRHLIVALGDEDGAVRLPAQACLAVTSKPLQCGANVELCVGAAGLVAYGGFGFDSLDPVRALQRPLRHPRGVEMLAGTNSLFAISRTATPEGPAPWHSQSVRQEKRGLGGYDELKPCIGAQRVPNPAR